MHADADVRLTEYDLVPGQAIPTLRSSGPIEKSIYGYTVSPGGTGTATFTIATSAPPEGERTLLLVTAGGDPGSSTRLSLVDGGGVRHVLGSPARWMRATWMSHHCSPAVARLGSSSRPGTTPRSPS